MTKVALPDDQVRRSRRRYVTLSLVIAMGVGALVAVLALPAIEHVIWPDAVQGRAR
jgi:hypothetical protein